MPITTDTTALCVCNANVAIHKKGLNHLKEEIYGIFLYAQIEGRLEYVLAPKFKKSEEFISTLIFGYSCNLFLWNQPQQV